MNKIQLANPIPVEEIKYLAEVMSKSGLFGKTPEQIASLALIAHAENRPLASVAMEYDVIQGRPALNSRTALSRFQLAGGCVRWIQSDSTIAKAEFSHSQGGSLDITWTIERAKEIGLATKDSWKKYPDQMLRARCCAEGIRAVYPACLGALYLSEEVQDFETPKKIRVINSKAVSVVVEDELEEDGVTGSIQVSENTNNLINACKEKEIEFPALTAWLVRTKRIPEGKDARFLDDDRAKKMLEHFDEVVAEINK